MNVGLGTVFHRNRISLRVSPRALQFFLLTIFLGAAALRTLAVELQVGNTYPVTLTNVDQHQLSTSDGHVTIITVVTREDERKAQTVGDRFSQSHLGDPKCRLITVVNFQQKIGSLFRGLAMAIIRHRLEREAKSLQEVYTAKHLKGNPRSDLFVVADFDGKVVSQLGIEPTSTEFAVFVFDGQGRLVRRWNDVPSSEALTAAINEAR